MQRNFILLLLLISCCLSSCAQGHDQKSTGNIAPTNLEVSEKAIHYSQIELADKFVNKLVNDTASTITEAQFSPIYIGNKSSQITLTYKPEKIGNRTQGLGAYKNPDKSSITILIDTTRTVGSPMGVWEYYKTPEYRGNKKAYPVFIENVTSDILSVGFGDILPIVIEAQDENGTWRPIQREFSYECGTGLTEFYLKPKQIAVTTMRQFYGDFRTKLRLAFGSSDLKVYSNEITGYINKGQFE